VALSRALTTAPGLKSPAGPGMRAAVLATVLAWGAITASSMLLPQVHSGYRRSALLVALETAASLIALLAAFLVAGRLRRRALLDDMMLASALAVLALSTLLFGTLPLLVSPQESELNLRALLACGMLGALLFALAAFVPRHRLSRSVLVSAGFTIIVPLVLARVLIHASTDHMRLPLEVARHTVPVLRPLPAQTVMAVLYGLAAIGFLNRCRQLGDEFMGWLSIAAVLAAASCIDYVLYPVLGSGSVDTSETLLLFFCAAVLVGSVREIWSYWHELSDTAVLEERRRIARDLHDGLAQELAYLVRNLDLLGEEASAETIARLRRAAERARAECRQAVHALVAPAGQTFEAALAEAAGEIAERFHVELVLDTIRDVQLPETQAEAMVRIACEAVTNAARHSGASRVCLSLEHEGRRLRLRVSDAGHGFDTSVHDGGFGLISMQERARSVGGELHVSSSLGRGSEVEAVI
jgi:signal transduction histidine kinase